jgi:hypothetical protein
MRKSVGRRSFLRGLLAIPLAAATLISLPAAVQLASVQPAGATGSAATLEPDAGQYVPIIPVVIYGATTLSAGATVTVPVEGANSQLPSSGISAVFVNIQETSPSTYGNISDCEADITPCTNQPAVTWTTSENESGSDVVTVAPPGTNNAGEINLTNSSSGTAVVAVQVGGYFTDGTDASPGSTYVPVSPTAIFDTREQGTSGHGLGLEDSFSGTSQTPDTTLPAGHTIIVPTVLLGVDDGVIASSDESNVTAVSLEIAGINGTTAGYLTVTGGAGTCSSSGTYPNPPNTRTVSYDSGEVNRLTDIEVPESSSCVNSSGQTQYHGGDVTIYNGGSGTVNVTIQLHGYFISPTTTDVTGDEYEPVSEGPVTVCSTKNSGCTIPTGQGQSFGENCVGGTGGETYTGSIPSDGCINFEVAGIDGVPSGATAIAAEVTANYSQESGWLDIAPYGGSNGNAQVNFSQSYGGDDESFEDAVVSDTSDGAISIYNDSSGTVDVTVSVRGVWNAATVPDPPSGVGTDYENATGTANVSWSAPDSDGGSPITSYTVLLNGAIAATVEEDANEDVSSTTVTCLPTDDISVEATNLVGTSAPMDAGTANPAFNVNSTSDGLSSVYSGTTSSSTPATSLPPVWTGQVVDATNNDAPVEATVSAYAYSPSASSDSEVGTVIPIGESTTNNHGDFAIYASPTSIIPTIAAADGTFDVYLLVSSGASTAILNEPMQIVTPASAIGSGITLPSPPTDIDEGDTSTIASSISNEVSDLSGSSLLEETPSFNQLSDNGSGSTSLDSEWQMSTDSEDSTLSANYQSNGEPTSDGGVIALNDEPVDAASSDPSTLTSVPELGIQDPADLAAFDAVANPNDVDPYPWGGSNPSNEYCGQTNVRRDTKQTFVPQQDFAARPSGDGMNTSWAIGADIGDSVGSQSTQSLEEQAGASVVTYDSMSSQTTGRSTSGMSTLGPYQNVSNFDHLGQWLLSLDYQETAVFNPAECFSYAQMYDSNWSVSVPVGGGQSESTGGTDLDGKTDQPGLLGCVQATWDDETWWNENAMPYPSTFQELWGYSYKDGSPAMKWYSDCLDLPQFQYHDGYYQSWKEWPKSSSEYGDIHVLRALFQPPLKSYLASDPSLPTPSACSSGVAIPDHSSYVVDQSKTSNSFESESIAWSPLNIPIGITFGAVTYSPFGPFNAAETSTESSGSFEQSSSSFAWYNTQPMSNTTQSEFLCPTNGQVVNGQSVVTPSLQATMFSNEDYTQAEADQLSDFIGSYEVCNETEAGVPVDNITTDISACG